MSAQNDLIDNLREQIALNEEHVAAKGEIIADLLQQAEERERLRLLHVEQDAEASSIIRRLGIHFREIADTARNIQAALRDNDPRDAAKPADEALQAIINAGDLFADSIAESAYTAIIDQLTEPAEGEEKP